MLDSLAENGKDGVRTDSLPNLLRQADVDWSHEGARNNGADHQTGSTTISKIQHRHENKGGPWADDAAVDTDEGYEAVQCPRDSRCEVELLNRLCV